jgi:serpin B
MWPLTRRAFLAASGLAAMTPGRLLAQQHPEKNPVVEGNTQFGIELYRQLGKTKGNIFYSPFSVSAALGMTAAGARGETLEEMRNVLHLPTNDAATDAGFQTLFAQLNAGDPKTRGFELSVANAIWGQKGYPWRNEFLTRVTSFYGAGLKEADFQSAPEQARAAINQWVEKETREKIRNLLAEGTITPLTRMVLANAIYFKGQWEAEFKKDQTKNLPFTLANGTKESTPMMQRTGQYGYAEFEDFQIAELPYKGGAASMVVLLPRRPDGLADFEKKLTAEQVKLWFSKIHSEPELNLTFPKFKLETEYPLNDPLKALGMKRAFADADFSGMSAGPEKLQISLVIQKAFVEVNEEGTEAAAATGVVVRATAALPPREPKVFKADRPFLFLIRHRPTESILFLGRYEKP